MSANYLKEFFFGDKNHKQMYLGVIKSSYSENREAAALNKGFCDSSFSADIAK